MGSSVAFRRVTALAAALAAVVAAGQSQAAACRDTVAELRGDWGQARFNVEIADDDGERAQGLMNRESMPKSAGMLFVYPREQSTSFWMRNTLIPLDMIFMDGTGTVTRVHSNAVPLDETPIPGGDDVMLVLEINGGLAKSLGIAPGTELRNPAVPQDGAAWPCDGG
ncbi:DUF192 domain-containing protein [Oceaniglobus roseus]|uniref:DUF192 domain-containing protein n=1 Tax=Oceaniglobus roseus TaxID=1737570 RepID=UPI000C7F095A|nr:DUF192 domain-containing protein [Kandeliimicrobium roseum]